MRELRHYLRDICERRHGHIQWSPNFSEFSFIKMEDVDQMTAMWNEAEAVAGRDGVPSPSVERYLRRVKRSREGHDRMAVAYREASKTHAPEKGLSEVPFYDFPVRRDGSWRMYNRAVPGMDYVADSEAAEGLAISVPGDDPSGYYKLPFAYGFYDVQAKGTFRKGVWEKPNPGNGYSWYFIDDVKIPEHPFYMFLTRSWAIQMNKTSPLMCGRTFRIGVRAKFEGKLYDRPGAVNRILVDRIAFIPIEKY